MSAEETLREILRSEATAVQPAGDGLARIEARIAARRQGRRWLLPSAVTVTVALAAAVVLLAPDHHRRQTLQTASPGATPTAAPSATPSVTPSVTTSEAPGPADDGGFPLDRPAIWPFTSQAEARGWRTSAPWAQDGLQVGRHFVADFLGLPGVTVTQACVSCGVLGLEVGGRAVGEVDLVRVGVGFSTGEGRQVYTVAQVSGTDLSVTSPTPGAAVSSPTRVTGRVRGVDENVALRLLAQDGTQLAAAGAPAGSAVPWRATLTWSRTDWAHGVIVGVTRSPRDGSVSRVVAVPVLRGKAA